MPRTQADVEEEKLRQRLQEAMVAAGVPQSRVSLEVLYWSPPEFVREYTKLFMKALHLGDGDDTERAGKDEGRQKSKVKDAGKDGGLRTRARGKTREGDDVEDGEGRKVGGGGTTRGARPGKKYKREWVVKDEEALEVKRFVDAALRGLIAKETRRAQRSRGETPPARGSTPGVGFLVGMGEGKGKRCSECGRIAAHDWARCPFPHS